MTSASRRSSRPACRGATSSGSRRSRSTPRARATGRPDRRRVTTSDNANVPELSANVVTVSADGGEPFHVTEYSDPAVRAYVGGYSPDGNWIVFRLEDHGQHALCLVRPDGTGLRTIMPLSDFRAPRDRLGSPPPCDRNRPRRGPGAGGGVQWNKSTPVLPIGRQRAADDGASPRLNLEGGDDGDQTPSRAWVDLEGSVMKRPSRRASGGRPAMRRVSAIVGVVLLLVLMLPAAAIAAEPGDEPDTAIPVSTGEAIYDSTAMTSNAAVDPASCGEFEDFSNTMWFSYTPAKSGVTLVDVASFVSEDGSTDFQAIAFVYRVESNGSLDPGRLLGLPGDSRLQGLGRDDLPDRVRSARRRGYRRAWVVGPRWHLQPRGHSGSRARPDLPRSFRRLLRR